MPEKQVPQIDGPRAEPASGAAAQQLVVLLHGLGADGNDLIQLAPLLQRALPDAAFVSPHAHQSCDVAPVGRQWFSFRSDDPNVSEIGTREAAPVVDAFLDQELARHGLGPDRLALIGFSQGGMLALHCGLRRSPPVAAVCGFSTLLPGAETLGQEIQARPPVLLTHGDSDQVIPAQALPHSVQALEANGVPVESETRQGLGHGIDERCLDLATAFLQRHLVGGAAA
jgi:phospholipase/carboxylesterase